MSTDPSTLDRRNRSQFRLAAIIFLGLMVAALVVAVAFPEVAVGPKKADIPLGGQGSTTDDNTAAGWLRALLGFGLVAGWVAVLGYQVRKARRRRASVDR